MSLRIVVTGLIAQHPHLGGMTWHYLHYVVGLARLGHDVYYVEDSGEVPYDLERGDPAAHWAAKGCGYHVGYLAKVMARFGLQERWAYRHAPESRWHGLSDGRRRSVIGSADLLLNVSGSLEHPDRYRQARRLVYLDTDPVVTQAKIAAGKPLFRARVDAHDVHFSFGERLGKAVPPTGHRWRPTRQPIVLSEWRPLAGRRDVFTTVMSWTSYAPLRHAGRTYGQKDVELRRFLELPGRVAPLRMEVALGAGRHPKWEARGDGRGLRPRARADERGERAPREVMARAGERGERAPGEVMARAGEREERAPREIIARAGWRVVDAQLACGDLDRYREYIQSSKAEWSVAKHAYVQGQPGWFSERSACYLASGRPVVVQDTGLAGVFPVGEGILPFATLEEAAAAIREVEGDYARHARAARSIAAECFDSDSVLARLIDQATCG
jgi:glycosyltransferase involved in cell wall biosynthesis